MRTVIVPVRSGFDYSAQWWRRLPISTATANGIGTKLVYHSASMNQTISRKEDTETIWRPDVTVATIVPRDGRFLLVEEVVRGELVLNQPAGHLEPDESLLDAGRRETLEETGWDVELTALVGIYQWANGNGSHFLRFTFAAKPIQYDPQRHLDDGIVRALWLTREEIAAEHARLRSPMVQRGVDDWLAGKRLPLDALVRVPSATADQ
jgi:8-oxo-dGTP pyrophosphatase MutT (NUDIX family)